jgi:hypothetical protein
MSNSNKRAGLHQRHHLNCTQHNWHLSPAIAERQISGGSDQCYDEALVWHDNPMPFSHLSGSEEAQAPSHVVTLPLPVSESSTKQPRPVSKRPKVSDTVRRDKRGDAHQHDQKKQNAKKITPEDDDQFEIQVLWPEGPLNQALKFPPPQLSLLTLGVHYLT